MLVASGGDGQEDGVRIVELSNHPLVLRESAAAERAAQQASADAERAAALARVADLRAQRRRALRAGRIGAWFGLWLATGEARRQVPLPTLRYAAPSRDEAVASAGEHGEDRAARQLGELFGEDWTLIHGYRGPAGEVDFLLLGPHGLAAIEVKALNGRFRINGDVWEADKYDKYDNRVEHLPPTTDRGGRSPSQQVNAIADALERHLGRSGRPVPIRRAVLLVHPRSRIKVALNLTVDAVGTSAKVIPGLFGDGPAVLDPAELADIERLIQQSHRDSPRPNARTPPARRRRAPGPR
jgi:hypothetical protein